MKTRILILILVLALFLTATGVVLADGGIEWPHQVLGGGASDSAAGNLTLHATLGQPVVGIVSGGEVTMGQGFWHGGHLPKMEPPIYLPLVQK